MSVITPPGTLYIVATPIGTLADLSDRAQRVLSEVDFVICEDTRHTQKLFHAMGIKSHLESLHDHNEELKSQFILDKIMTSKSKSAAIVTDAGTPAVSDPGAILVKLAHQAAFQVLSVPGPSSLSAALGAGGFVCQRKIFSGFFPRETKDRLDEILFWKASAPCVAVFFESPKRIQKSIHFLATELKDSKIEICISKELSKKFEQHWHGSLPEISARLELLDSMLGEYVVQVYLPKETKDASSSEGILHWIAAVTKAKSLVDSGLGLKVASKQAGLEFNLPAKSLYAELSKKETKLSERILNLKPVFEKLLTQNPTRASVVKLTPADGCSREDAILAARIYKRGVRTLEWAEEANSELIDLDHLSNDSSNTQFSLNCPLILSSENALVQKLSKQQKGRFVIIDKQITLLRPLWRHIEGFSHSTTIVAQENLKTLQTVSAILQDIEDQVAEKVTEIWSVGGGLTSDLGGFVAGLLGAQHHVVPTTFLAAVDAGIGGKTGVNAFPWGKNMLGLFHPVSAFTLCTEVFSSLPEPEYWSGHCEALKQCYLAGDSSSLELLSSKISSVQTEVLLKNFEFKNTVTLHDPKESHIRAFLNFGHTLGHAWESLASAAFVTALPHGVAVGLGMWILLNQQDWPAFKEMTAFKHSLEYVLSKFDISFHRNEQTELVKSAFLKAVISDKKNAVSGTVRFVKPLWGSLNFEDSDSELWTEIQMRTLYESQCADLSLEEAWLLFADGVVAWQNVKKRGAQNDSNRES